MCLRQLHLPLQTKLDEFQSELFQVDLRLRLAARGRSSSLFFGLVSHSLLPHALSKFFSKQPQFPCFFTQIIPLLILSSGLKCSSMSFGRSYCHSDSLFLFFVSCSGFEIRYTLKGRLIQPYGLVCSCCNHTCLGSDDLGFSFPQRNGPHVVSWNLESRYPVQFTANRFQRRTTSIVFSKTNDVKCPM